MKTWICALIGAGVLLAPPTQAQSLSQCPVGKSPATLLSGPWTFSMRGILQPATITGPQPFATLGTLIATPSSTSTASIPLPSTSTANARTGVLSMKRISSNNGLITRSGFSTGFPVIDSLVDGVSITLPPAPGTVVTGLDTETGTYEVNADCSGGTLILNFPTGPRHFSFIFSGPMGLSSFDSFFCELSFLDDDFGTVVEGIGRSRSPG